MSRNTLVGYFLAFIFTSILFSVMEGIVNANPLARDLFRVYAPIARKSFNLTAGMRIGGQK